MDGTGLKVSVGTATYNDAESFSAELSISGTLRATFPSWCLDSMASGALTNGCGNLVATLQGTAHPFKSATCVPDGNQESCECTLELSTQSATEVGTYEYAATGSVKRTITTIVGDASVSASNPRIDYASYCVSPDGKRLTQDETFWFPALGGFSQMNLQLNLME